MSEPKHGEPWHVREPLEGEGENFVPCVDNRFGNPVAPMLPDFEIAKRIAACGNACAGMDNPQAEIARLRAEIARLKAEVVCED